MNRETQFLDFLEDRLSPSEKEKFESALENDQALKTAFEQYKQLASIEGFIAKEQHQVAPSTSVIIMDKIEALTTKRSSVMFEKLLSKRFLFPSTALVTACVALMVAHDTAKENDISLTKPGAYRESSTTNKNDATVSSSVTVAEPVEASDEPQAQTKPLIDGAAVAERFKQVGAALSENEGRSQSQATVAVPMRPKASELGVDGEQPKTQSIPIGPAKPFGEDVLKKDFLKEEMGSEQETAPSTYANVIDKIGQLAGKGSADATSFAEETSNRKRQAATSGLIADLAAVPAPAPQAIPERGLESFSEVNDYARRVIAPLPPQYPSGGEQYGVYEENQRVAVAEQPVSTFSIDVDTGSFTNLRRYLSMGQLPPKDSVRIEELINYFDYNYPTQGDKPFTVSYEIAPSPLEPERFLMKVGVQAKQVELNSELGWNLVFLVDVSGSMSSANKLPLLKKSLSVLVDKMRAVDRVAIVTYASSAGLALPSTSGAEKERIRQVIENLQSGGGTNGSGGIDLAYQIAEQNKIAGSVNRVILATDGDFNVGTYSFDGLMNLIEAKRKNGISLTTLGFGEGNYNEKNLEQLADRGNGNYFYLDSFKEARRVLEEGLTGNMLTIAKDVKLQVEFNPKNVVEYRLVGYDNRKLRNQDFNNDNIDAGEIGSGHTVTAIYEIVLARSELAKTLQEELRYQASAKREEVASDTFPKELAFVKIRYKEPEGTQSKLLSYPIYAESVKTDWNAASEDFRFAAAVSYFGHLLRGSSFVGNYDYQRVLELAKNARGADERGKRREMIELMANAKALGH